MRKFVLIALLLAGCSHRERQQELLDRVKQQELENAAPISASEPLVIDNSSVTVSFNRAERTASGMDRFDVTVDNRTDQVIKFIGGQVFITTTSNPGGIQLGFEIPQRIAAKQSTSYAMPVDRDPAGQEARWPREDDVTGATFRVERVVAQP
jgi:hypothetical protein